MENPSTATTKLPNDSSITPTTYAAALERALGRVIAKMQREADVVAAEGRAVIAELRAQNVALAAEIRTAAASIKDGEKGDQGGKGEKGETGETGETGPPGEAGLSGERGADGRDGSDGEKGDRGNDGERGPAGIFPIVKAWAEGVHYMATVVAHGGSLYQAARDTAKEPGTSDDWVCIAAKGAAGRSFKIRGTYADGKTYSEFDVVCLNAGSFIALKDGAGICPGPDWQLIAGPGKRGDKGLPGDTGQRGNPGIGIADWKIDADKYTAIPIMTDGKQGPPIKLHDLFARYDETKGD